jgi:hypothetical protein
MTIDVLRQIKTSEGCSIWKHSKDTQGYGYIKVKGKQRIVTRIVYELTKGPIPDGMRVLHTCDNPSCISPDHLFLGTQKDNMQDALSKGRIGPLFYHGEMWLMRKLYKHGTPLRHIALMFKTRHGRVKKIVDDINYPGRELCSI